MNEATAMRRNCRRTRSRSADTRRRQTAGNNEDTKIPTTPIVHSVDTQGNPSTHVLVIGIGDYPHLAKGSGTLSTHAAGMGQLSLPPVLAQLHGQLQLRVQARQAAKVEEKFVAEAAHRRRQRSNKRRLGMLYGEGQIRSGRAWLEASPGGTSAIPLFSIRGRRRICRRPMRRML
jgi:hypothetical protein